jgi:histidinol phosphatase-like PHP family hydrolase
MTQSEEEKIIDALVDAGYLKDLLVESVHRLDKLCGIQSKESMEIIRNLCERGRIHFLEHAGNRPEGRVITYSWQRGPGPNPFDSVLADR